MNIRLWTLAGTDTTTRHPIHLILRNDRPVLLGEGRFARVYLGVDGSADELSPGNLVAIKFLQTDESTAVTRNYVYRFYQEVAKTHECRKMGVQDSVVRFSAFGRLGGFSPSDLELLDEVFATSFSRTDRQTPSTAPNLFRGWSIDALDAVFEENRIPGDLLVGLTGDFYAMDLCLISLEELLVAHGSPTRLSGASALDACGISTATIQQWIAQKRNEVRRLSIRLDHQANGFQDLNELDRLLTGTYSDDTSVMSTGSFRSAVLFQLAVACLDQVAKLHQFPHKEETGLAHRDLKPGNVLLSMAHPPRFVLCDLGFIAAVSEIKLPGRTRVGSLEEGGVLPAGSRGFRAPEQIESGQDIAFTVHAASESATETEIVIHSHFGSPPDSGDWLHTRGPSNTGARKHRMISVNTDAAGGVVCTVPREFSVTDGALFKGRIVKDISLHSDIYALGCIAYYLGSEGRDPEHFMQTFVDPLVRAMFRAQLPPWVVSSPLWMAATLTQEEPDVVARDLIKYVREMSPLPRDEDTRERLHVLVVALSGGVSFSLGAETLAAIAASVRNHDEIQMIRQTRRNVAENRALRELLLGKVSRRPLSFPQLFLIFLCCMRDEEESIVRRSDKVVDEHGQCLEVYNRGAHEYASRISEIATRLLRSPSLFVKLERWASLGREPMEVFLTTRISAERSAVVALKSGERLLITHGKPESMGGVVTVDVLDDAAAPERILMTDLDSADSPSLLREVVRQMQQGGQATPIFAFSAIVKDCATLADVRVKCAALTGRSA